MTADVSTRKRICALLLALGVLAAAGAALAGSAQAAAYAPGVVVVGVAPRTPARVRDATLVEAGMASARSAGADVREIALRPGVSVAAAIRRLRGRAGVRWAVPDYIAHIATAGAPSGIAFPFGLLTRRADQITPTPFAPDDPGDAGVPGGWAQLQWNFAGQYGVGAEQAWGNLIADGRPGGSGVTVAVLDTGIAYANRGRFVRSPDFAASQFVAGYDFVGHSPYAEDRNGHGTLVAGEIAEETNNDVGVTGLAYGVRLMPVRVLNSEGNGSATTIARGIYFAVNHHAQIINLSLEFNAGSVSAAQIPQLIAALRYAYDKGVLVVAASGNEGAAQLSYPAKDPYALAVGATTIDGCLASYSNYGNGLGLVAPGGGGDAALADDANCRPGATFGPDDNIIQETFAIAPPPRTNPRQFDLNTSYFGTSMAAPEVSAAAALVIASGVLGPHPTPTEIIDRLEQTATPLGAGGKDDPEHFGAGLLDAAAATAPPGSTGGTTGPSGTTGASG